MKIHNSLVKVKNRQSQLENCNSILEWCVNHLITVQMLKERRIKNNYNYYNLVMNSQYNNRKILTSKI